MKDEAQQFSLQGEGISVGYQQNIIIPKMDVQIPKGKITSIIGPNGCGKSTLLKALSRMMPVQSGAVLLDGQAIATLPTVEVARKMAILPQSPQAPGGLTVEELVSYGRYPHQNACMDISNSKERRILLKMRTKEAAGFLYLENPTAHNVEILDNKIVPSKTTSIEHGYGLKNVTAILDNIGALYVFDYNSQKQLFSFSAQLPISH